MPKNCGYLKPKFLWKPNYKVGLDAVLFPQIILLRWLVALVLNAHILS